MKPLRIELKGGLLRAPDLLPEERGPGYDLFRQVDIASIRRFMMENHAFLTGRVLDFGAGKPGTCRHPQPHRDLVHGEYIPYDIGDPWPLAMGEVVDAVMMNQVMEYIDKPDGILHMLGAIAAPGGHLVVTYKTNWEECEAADKWRLTKAGMIDLLRSIGAEIVVHDRRAEIDLGGFVLATGYGVVARL